MKTEKDPRVEAAMAEINEIMKKHDVAGIVAVCTPNSLRYQMKLEASWNCTTHEFRERDGASGVRVNSKGLIPELKKPRVEGSAASICAMAHIADLMSKDLNVVVKMLSQHLDLSFIMKRLE